VGFEVINLGSDKPIVLREVIRVVEELAGCRAAVEYSPRHPADVLATWANIEKADKLLGWRPKTLLHEGLGELVSWYRENRSWAREIVTN
jgi:nucleoside-diphosphate-sugar epimerase